MVDEPREDGQARRWNGYAIAWLAVALGFFVVQVSGFFWLPVDARAWVAVATTVPIVVPLLTAAAIVGAHATTKPWVRRDSILGRWLSGVRASVGALVGLGAGALLGAIVGSGFATSASLAELRPTIQVVLVVVAAGMFVAITWWTLVMGIDMHRLGPRRRAKSARRLLKGKRARGAVDLVAHVSGPVGVGLSGIFLLMLIAQLSAWANSALAIS